MVPMALSSAVTVLTATVCYFLARNLNETDFISDPADNARLTAQIMAEVEADEDEESDNVADYRTLEALIEEQLTAEPGGPEAVKVPVKETSFTSQDVPVQKSSPDLVIEAIHHLRNSGGQHRSYALSLHFSPRPRLEAERAIPWTKCHLRVEWPLPRSVFVDVWALRRSAGKSGDDVSPLQQQQQKSTIVATSPLWQVKPRHPDIEAGAFDLSRAKPFLLTADLSFRELGVSPLVRDGRLLDADAPWDMELSVPDLVVRYQAAQAASHLLAQVQSAPIYLPAPALRFTCARGPQEEISVVRELELEWRLHRLRPIEISLPVGAATPFVGQFTFGMISASSLLLISLLLKI
jgi:hypothetical protein